MSNVHGSKWIRREKRLAIYLRDGFACCYCGKGVEEGPGVPLPLDHVIPRSQGGGNETSNVVSCCGTCNFSRQDRPVEKFAVSVAAYLGRGRTAKEIVKHVHHIRQQPIDVQAAKDLIARRGSYSAAIESAA